MKQWSIWSKCDGQCGFNVSTRSRECLSYTYLNFDKKNVSEKIDDIEMCGDLQEKKECHVGTKCVSKYVKKGALQTVRCMFLHKTGKRQL